MIQINARTSNRRGAALIIALVLMLLVSAISATLIRGFYTDRRERDQSLIRIQADLLRQDFAECTNNTQATALTLHTDSFDGTFQLTTNENGAIVEYYDDAKKLIYTGNGLE